MISEFVREQKRYTQNELCHILKCSEEHAIPLIRKLKEFGVLKAVKASDIQKNMADLLEEDIEMVDVEVGENEYFYVFTFVGVIVVAGRVLKCYPKYLLNAKEPTDELRKVIKVLEKYNAKEQIVRMFNDTALDYDRTAKTTKQFFAKVQNKMHYAVHGHTAAELIYERADADKPHMGLTTWAAAPEGKIVKSDVSVAKNYLSEKEMRSLERIVSAYLDLAEDRAERHIPMTMEDWAKRLDLFLMADDREVLQDAGKITAEIAKAKAETEFEKYRIIQDRLFMSDFDKYMLELEENAKK